MSQNVLWYFFIYAFLGWCIEVVYTAGTTGRFVNRGFLNGPLCPVYGIGFILVISILEPVKNNMIYMFLGAMLLASLLELITGYILERIFKQKWWDYSDKPFNLGGYICLLFSIRWGLACLIMVDRVHPHVAFGVSTIPTSLGKIILTLLLLIFLVDFLATIQTVMKLNHKLKIMDEAALKISYASESLGENLAKGTLNLIQKKDELGEVLENKKTALRDDLTELREAKEKAFIHRKQVLGELQESYAKIQKKTHFGQERLFKAFPALRSINNHEALEKIKHIASKKEKS